MVYNSNTDYVLFEKMYICVHGSITLLQRQDNEGIKYWEYYIDNKLIGIHLNTKPREAINKRVTDLGGAVEIRTKKDGTIYYCKEGRVKTFCTVSKGSAPEWYVTTYRFDKYNNCKTKMVSCGVKNRPSKQINNAIKRLGGFLYKVNRIY